MKSSRPPAAQSHHPESLGVAALQVKAQAGTRHVGSQAAVPWGGHAIEKKALDPHMSPTEVAETTPEVRGFEPTAALAPKGGLDGLEDLRRIIAAAPGFLAEGGLLALETGPAQHPELLALTKAAGFARSSSEQDLTERDRFVFAWK